MSVLSKMLGAATKLTRAGQPMDATKKLQDSLGALTGKAGLWRQTDGTHPMPGLPELTCFGAPGNVDFSKGLAGLRDAVWPGRPAPMRGPTETDSEHFRQRITSGPHGSRAYKLFVPEGPQPPRILIVMLHGCTQDSDDFAAGTRMNILAQTHGALVAYPEQSRSANPSLCWNWFERKDQRRDTGEPGILAGLAQEVAAEFEIGPGRTFTAGLSAGGAMAAILAETYPDVFAGVGIHSGLPYGAAHDIPSAFAAMQGKAGPAGAASAGNPREASLVQHHIPTIVFHGDADRTVHRSNAEAIVARVEAQAAGLCPETQKGTVPGGRGFVRTTGRDASGAVRFEHWTVTGAGHAWSGGSPAGSYTDPSGPDASAEMLRFFLEQAARG